LGGDGHEGFLNKPTSAIGGHAYGEFDRAGHHLGDKRYQNRRVSKNAVHF
jgi:hypothetical protein